MKSVTYLSLLSLFNVAYAHGDHGGPETGETIQQYAQRHVGIFDHLPYLVTL
jgi:hypothetical protein